MLLCPASWFLSPIAGAAASTCRHQRLTALDTYATRALAIGCGGRQMSFASLRRFCAVAVSSTSSFTPLKPRRRSQSSLWMPLFAAALFKH